MKNLTTITLLSFSILLIAASCGSGTEETETESSDAKETMQAEVQEKESAQNTEGPFDVKSGTIHYENKKPSGELVSNHVLYFDDYGRTIRLDETIDGETSQFLYSEDKKKGATIWSGRDPISISMRQGEINAYVAKQSESGFTQQEDASILGQSCTVFANNMKDANGDPKVQYWMYKGIPLKEINLLGSGYMFEAVKFEEKQVDRAMFAYLDKN